MDLGKVAKLIQAAGLHERKRLQEKYLPEALARMQWHVEAKAGLVDDVRRFLSRFLQPMLDESVRSLIGNYELAPAILGGDESCTFSLLASRIPPTGLLRCDSRNFTEGQTAFVIGFTPGDDAVQRGAIRFRNGKIEVDAEAFRPLGESAADQFRLYCLCNDTEAAAGVRFEFFALGRSEGSAIDADDFAGLFQAERHLEAARLLSGERYSDDERRARLAVSYSSQIRRIREEMKRGLPFLGPAEALLHELEESIGEVASRQYGLEVYMRRYMAASQ